MKNFKKQFAYETGISTKQRKQTHLERSLAKLKLERVHTRNRSQLTTQRLKMDMVSKCNSKNVNESHENQLESINKVAM